MFHSEIKQFQKTRASCYILQICNVCTVVAH